MVITEETPITMAEVAGLVGDSDREKEIKTFIKKFVKMDAKKAKEMSDELKALDLIKLKDAYIVKIVDFMPEDTSELNKVVSEVSLDQEEITKILDVVKKY
jgi:DNA-directed RNA polymerase subunit F